jgi:hypothetical protein
VIRLLELFDIDVGYSLFTDDKDEFLAAFAKRQTGYFGSLLFIRRPSAHCRRIGGLNGDTVEMMEPHPTHPQMIRAPWTDLSGLAPRYFLMSR